MPPLDQLPKPVMSPMRKAGLLILRGYLLAAVLNGFLASLPAASVGYSAVRALVALVLGAAVGLERQWRQRTAGLRTNALVSLGAALFELFAVLLSGEHGVDPTRIAAYVVSGIGFLGAGVILRDGIHVRGINTATTIWCSAAVGVLADAGYLSAAAIVRAADEAHIRALVVQSLTRDDFVLRSLRSQDLDGNSGNGNGGLVEVAAELHRTGRDDAALEAAVSRLSLEPSVSSVRWNIREPAALDEAGE